LKPIFETESGKLYNADAFDLMDLMIEKGILADMIFADPPYNIGKAEWDDFAQDEYLEWSRKWITKATEVLKESGSLFVMGFSEILADIKYLVTRDIKLFESCRWLVWHYRNKPSLGRKDWVRSHESILHFRKGRDFTFNLDSIREPYNVHTLKYPVRSQGSSSQYGNRKASLKQTYLWKPNEVGAKPRDVIILPAMCNPTRERMKHPTQKPEELLRKLVLVSTKEGNLVLDPFVGSGTTPVVCEQLRRRWIGSEISAKYCKVTIERLEHVPKDLPQEHWLEIDRKRETHRAKVRGQLMLLT